MIRVWESSFLCLEGSLSNSAHCLIFSGGNDHAKDVAGVIGVGESNSDSMDVSNSWHISGVIVKNKGEFAKQFFGRLKKTSINIAFIASFGDTAGSSSLEGESFFTKIGSKVGINDDAGKGFGELEFSVPSVGHSVEFEELVNGFLEFILVLVFDLLNLVSRVGLQLIDNQLSCIGS